MTATQIRLERARASLELAEGRLLIGQGLLDDLIARIGEPEPFPVRYQLCECLLDRARANFSANRWLEMMPDLDRAETISRAFNQIYRPLVLQAVDHLRGKVLAVPGTLIHDPARVRDLVRDIRELGVDESSADELECDLAIGEGDWSRVPDLEGRATRWWTEHGWPSAAAGSRLRACRAFLELGDLDRAEAELALAYPFFDRWGPPEQKAIADARLAQIQFERKRIDEAWESINRALAGLETLIRHVSSLFSQQRFVLDKMGVYRDAFLIGLAKGETEGFLRAWAVAERSKSFYLCQLVANADIPLFEGVEPERIARLGELDRRLDESEAALSRARLARAAEGGAELEERQRSLSRERQDLLEDIMRRNPRWAALRTPPPLDVAAELQRLDPGWSVLSYYWEPRDSGARLHLFRAGRDREPGHRAVDWSHADLKRFDDHRRLLTGMVPPSVPSLPNDLAAKLLPADVLAAFEPDSCLLVSPHERLQSFPIHALATGAGKRLIELHPVQTIPTLALLALGPSRREPGSILLAGCAQDGFGDPALDAVPGEIEALGQLWSTNRPGRVTSVLIPAVGTLDEAGVPLKLWSDYECVHVACHGVFPEDRPLDAALRLGRGEVRMSDFFATRLQASAVILSACALGRHAERQEGVELVGNEWVGVHLPLFYAGARSVLASLWDANSFVAARFMKSLHAGLGEGASPARAFQRAVLAVARLPEPFWANWSLAGFPDRSDS